MTAEDLKQVYLPQVSMPMRRAFLPNGAVCLWSEGIGCIAAGPAGLSARRAGDPARAENNGRHGGLPGITEKTVDTASSVFTAMKEIACV